MIISKKEMNEYEKSTTCWICGGRFSNDDMKVRDHCHLSGKFRGAAHRSCDLKYRVSKFLPVFFHNTSGYDAHLFIKSLAETWGKIDCIASNEEKYISFSKQVKVDTRVNEKGEEKHVTFALRFVDSLKFMASSLEQLVSNLASDSKNRFKTMQKYYKGKKLDLLLRKGVYPYEYMDKLDKLDESELPLRSAFFSSLNGECISEEDYEHARKVWRVFGCKALRDYHNLYNEADVLLLCDVFENFRDVCRKNYGLDPAWYYTAPGLAWDACLKKTGVRLELLSDSDMLLMIEKGTRGGISMISNRYGQANNKYMGEKFDKNEPSKFISYLDANNLYGWAMAKKLPTHGFVWMDECELKNWQNYSCFLEVDLLYPEELHDLHNEYPLAPERKKINNVEKLIPNVKDKEKYVLHCENLKLSLQLGMKLTKIHGGI
ncbi:uncharacterized protein LOC111322716 [Stylophora pistillata]|nr:uncharacterized protein LOC111322716 [Stylophora pistillata]